MRKRGVPWWVWGLGSALALVCLVAVLWVAVLGPRAPDPEQFEGAITTARPTTRPTTRPKNTAVPSEPTTPPSSHWETNARTLELTHGAYEIIAYGTGDFVVALEMFLRDPGAGDGQINFNIEGPSETHIVAIMPSTGEYALQGGGAGGLTVFDAIETSTDAHNHIEIWGEHDVVSFVVNGELLAEFDHATTGTDNIVYLTVYHDVMISIEGIDAAGID
jgi:hypothetical protein